MDNFLLARPENQWQSQLKVRFYSRSYIILGDQVGYSNGGRNINYILQLTSYSFNEAFLFIWIKQFSFKKHSSFLSVVFLWL